MKKVLVVLTNVSKYYNNERATGLWFRELVHFVDIMKKEGFIFEYTSPNGGYIPIDPYSLWVEYMTSLDWEYYTNGGVMNNLGKTIPSSNIDSSQYDIIYYTGGHGVMWDFTDSKCLQDVARDIYENGGIVSVVCHGVIGLSNIKLSDGRNLIDGIKVTGFSNSEEMVVGLDKMVPFLTESEL